MAQSSATPKFEDSYNILGEIVPDWRGETVKKCISKKDQTHYAVKVLNAVDIPRERMDRELDICKTLTHEHVIKMVESFVRVDVYHLVFEMVTEGDMMDDIVTRTLYTEEDACHCIEQVFKGVAYLHSKNIIHRDLKPDNLLLRRKDKDAVVKICDFGSAIVTKVKITSLRFRGTKPYKAPEVYERLPYGSPFDMWSCGVIFYILLFGMLPFRGHRKPMFVEICEGEYLIPEDEDSYYVCDQAKDLIGHLLNVDQDARYTANDALQHPFIRDRTKIHTRFHRTVTLKNMKAFNERKREWKSENIDSNVVAESGPLPKSKSDGAIVRHTIEATETHPASGDSTSPPLSEGNQSTEVPLNTSAKH